MLNYDTFVDGINEERFVSNNITIPSQTIYQVELLLVILSLCQSLRMFMAKYFSIIEDS